MAHTSINSLCYNEAVTAFSELLKSKSIHNHNPLKDKNKEAINKDPKFERMQNLKEATSNRFHRKFLLDSNVGHGKAG